MDVIDLTGESDSEVVVAAESPAMQVKMSIENGNKSARYVTTNVKVVLCIYLPF